MPKQLLPLALLLCLLAACGGEPEPATTVVATMGENLCALALGPFVIEEDAQDAAPPEGAAVAHHYTITSSEEGGLGQICLTAQDGALAEARLRVVFENDNSLAEAIVEAATVFDLLQLMDDAESAGNGLIFTDEGNRMLEAALLQMLEDLGLDEALRAEVKERFLDIDWAENDGVLEARFGDYDLRRLFILPDGDSPGSIDFYILPVTKQT